MVSLPLPKDRTGCAAVPLRLKISYREASLEEACPEHPRFALYQPRRRTVRSRALPPTASAFAIRLGFCDSPSRGE